MMRTQLRAINIYAWYKKEKSVLLTLIKFQAFMASAEHRRRYFKECC